MAMRSEFNLVSGTVGRRSKSLIIGVTAGMLLAASVLLFGTCRSSQNVARRSRVIVQSSGLGSFESPYGIPPGDANRAQFGALPLYLRAMGYQVSESADPLKGCLLDSVSVLVVFNPQVPIKTGARGRLYTFLNRGGTLLLVGDHTNVGGTLPALNSYLQGTPIRFRFDAAVATRWPTTLSLSTGFPQHPLRGDGRLRREHVPWGVGASLQVRWPGSALYTMKEGFSDRGDPSNAPSFLGNQSLDPGELEGDLPLIAFSQVGQGRVVVFGDTGLFQDPSLFVSTTFVDRVFAYAVSGSRPLWPAEVEGMLLAGVGLVLLLKHGRPRVLLITCALLYLLSIGIHHPWERIEPRFPRYNRLALYDFAHAEHVSPLAKKGSVQMLNSFLLAKGYLPVAVWTERSDLMRSASLILVIDPKGSFSRSSAERLLQMQERGGSVLMCAGSEDADNVKPLLSPLGLEVTPIPLGTGAEAGSDVIFSSAYGIKVLSPTPIVIRRLWKYPVVVSANLGRGRTILISDSQFARNENLSDHPGSIVLLDSLLAPGILRMERH